MSGIVRKDTLAYLERKDFADNIRNQFVYVAKMFNEEMHVLAPMSIKSMKDLDGKTVAVDLPDGSTFVTSINVFERLGIKPHLLYIEPRIALERLRRGEIDAIIAVEGKPLQWLGQVSDPNLHLVPVEYDRELRDEYLPSQLTALDYPNLISTSAPVDTIAAEAVLASYNWQPGSDRYRRLSLLVESLFTHMAQLQRPPYHPKWMEFAPLAPLAGWTRFRTAQEWVNAHTPMAAAVDPVAMTPAARASNARARSGVVPRVSRMAGQPSGTRRAEGAQIEPTLTYDDAAISVTKPPFRDDAKARGSVSSWRKSAIAVDRKLRQVDVGKTSLEHGQNCCRGAPRRACRSTSGGSEIRP